MKASSIWQRCINNQINYSLRILITLSLLVIPCWSAGFINAISPLILGVIASALAENDDNLEGRAKGLVITLVCFTITSFSTEYLFPYPVIFALGLTISTFCFTMLGAMGSRYGNIAFASLLIAIYTMLSMHNSAFFGAQASLLLCGALIYGLISLLWLKLWPTQQIQHNLSQLYKTLGNYLSQIAENYFPSQHMQNNEINDAKQNADVVKALNLTRFSLVSLIRKGEMSERNQHFLRVYFIAQDIHERATALQSPSHQFKNFFFHSDLLFRFRHMLAMQSAACKDIANSILTTNNYAHNTNNLLALDDLNSSITHLKEKINKSIFMHRLDTIWQNIVKIESLFERIDKLDDKFEFNDQNITDPDALHVKDMAARVLSQLNVKSLIFRHAFRLSIALLLGYTIIVLFNLSHGYWILLTILLVCQANYSATRKKLSERISGTFLGLLFGLPLLLIFPDQNSQITFLILFGVLFFAFRANNYMISTIFITLFALVNANQHGNSYEVVFPRMLETLTGCFIAIFSVRYILPDWQVYRMRGIMADAIEANQKYLAQIFIQFRLGKSDTLSYRQARRDAHNKDAELTQAISNMLNEPGRYHSSTDESFRFLCLNHNVLNHISNLGALRQHLEEAELNELQKYREIFESFYQIKDYLLNPFAKDKAIPISFSAQNQLETNIENDTTAKIAEHLNAIASKLPEMHNLACTLANTLKKSRI